MATLVFGAIGKALGGGLGGAIGALIGRQVDGMIFAPSAREGARLSDLAVTTSSYGQPIARHHGRMRVAGTIIWATDLREQRQTQGGGKGRPAVTSYSYSASFAVALSSRPLLGIGRIWADGNLLRGAGGDLKVGGALRFHAGHGDQMPDPLLAAAEGAGQCPAYRGLAYVVFEDLQLADFGNRLPALSFEVLADLDSPRLADLFAADPALATVPADLSVDLGGLAGISVEGSLAATMAALAPVCPFACDVAGGGLRIIGEPATIAVELPDAAVSVADDAFGGPAGFARQWWPPTASLPGALRYYDVDRDYQPGLQRASGGPPAGQPATLELAAGFQAGAARSLIETAARRAGWGRQTLAWRCATLDPALTPGALVRAPGQAGVWRVASWEWRESGVDLMLERVPGPAGGMPAATTSAHADAGRAAAARDLAGGPTELAVIELPWDGSGAGDRRRVYAALSSTGAGWTGAALYRDDGPGGLVSIGASGRTRAALGRALDVLAPASSLLPDRAGSVVIELIAPDQDLADATGAQLAQGANRALLGDELIQFARAEPLGQGRWRLGGLLRGRGGTEAATGQHRAGEAFVLLDDRLIVLDDATADPSASLRIAAIGLGDAAPVTASLALAGIARRPLMPVHPRCQVLPDGGLLLRWTRRARGAWTWPDQADTPLHEEAEHYEVLLGAAANPFALWQVGEPSLTLSAAQCSSLRAAYPGAPLLVRQRGSYAASAAVLLGLLS